MGRKTHSPVRERKDYTRLLSELQGQTPSSPAEVAVAAQDEEKEPYSPYRQRIMSDEKVKYLYSRNGGMLHDKSCPGARDIPDEELCRAEGYPTNISQCPLCAMKAYVRLGARDFYNFPLYEKHFERMRFTPRQLRRMYVNDRMRTSASNNGLTIWGKEDSWRLEYRDNGNAMRLMHNNYRPLPDGTRIFTKGYHLQAKLVTAKHALNVISEYTYEGHKAAILRRKQERLKQQAGTQSKGFPMWLDRIAGMLRLIWKQFTSWLRRISRK